MHPNLLPHDFSPHLIELHSVRLQSVVALYAARTKEERDALYKQAALLSTLLDLPVPMLPPARSHVVNATLSEFWALVEEGVTAGHLFNHSRADDRLAINLLEARAAAVRMGRPLAHGTTLRRALEVCPRLITANRTVNSRVREKAGKGIAVRCWIFKK